MPGNHFNVRTEITIGFFDVVVFLGVFQGLIISWFFIRNGSRKHLPNLYQGLLILILTIAISEEWLNNTGLIVKVLPISNYSEFLNFVFGPLFFLFVRRSLSIKASRKEWFHFTLAVLWLGYMVFHFMQSPEFKYNSYLWSKHPDWQSLEVQFRIGDDPLGIRPYLNPATGVHFFIYILASWIIFIRKLNASGEALFKVRHETLRGVRNSLYHFSMIVIIFLSVKISFESDIGDYFISSYISFMILTIAWQIMSQSNYFDRPHSFLEFPVTKYQKSSISEETRTSIMEKINLQMDNGYYMNNMASLSDLAKNIHETTHHVSQVINETLGESFYELLARLRVDEAKRILSTEEGKRITVEDLADQVGYNSKSSLNRAFKKLAGQTPTEFRDTDPSA